MKIRYRIKFFCLPFTFPNIFIFKYLANKFPRKCVYFPYDYEYSKKYIIKSFQKELLNEVNSVINILPKNKIMRTSISWNKYKFINVNLNSNNIKIPYRIGINEVENKLIDNLNHTQKLILYCIYTRHHNGFIRQKYIEKLINENNYFITPFIIQMIGEYVSEIMIIIDKYLENNIENYIKFKYENKKYWKYLRGSMASYWDTYQRNKYPKYDEYIGKIILDKINGITMIYAHTAHNIR